MRMKYFFILGFLFFSTQILLQSQPRTDRHINISRDGESDRKEAVSKIFYDRPVQLEGAKLTGDYVIGPEIVIPGATGFYDYQTNGECKHYINRFSGNIMSAIYMVSTDSMNISDSRRTVYCVSSNDGNTWDFLGQVPNNLRSGFPSLTTYNGEAIICNHYIVGAPLRGVVAMDLAPLVGSFDFFPTPYNIAWPGCGRFSNGMILIAGESYHSGAATDSGIVSIFNPLTHTFSNTTRFNSNASSQLNMRWTYAAGPNGKALYLIDALSDVGGNGGYNRMFISFTTNYGANWTTPMLEFYNPQVLLGQMAIPFFGLDAIYDSLGNYYVAFNTTDEFGDYGSARLWVSKNGGTPVLVAQHNGLNGIPEAAEILVSPQAGLCTIDHPSLSVSSDGTIIYVAYGVANESDVLNDFNKSHIYISVSLTGSLLFSPPIKVTNSGTGSFDERYVGLAQSTPNLGGAQGRTVFMVYQKDPQPGSSSFSDLAPISRASLIFRKISDLSYPVGIAPNNNIPLEMKLGQNFPNPFNPVTIIEYAIPTAEYVELKVYDMLGREVETIVNEFLRAGNYKAVFTGKNLTSGVYLYKLSSGNFVETKKMMLIK